MSNFSEGFAIDIKIILLFHGDGPNFYLKIPCNRFLHLHPKPPESNALLLHPLPYKLITLIGCSQ